MKKFIHEQKLLKQFTINSVSSSPRLKSWVKIIYNVKPLQWFLLAVLIISQNTFAADASFTLSAEVTRNAAIKLDLDYISAYIKNLEIYSRFFPNIVSVRQLEDKQSEWIYKVEAPLASPYNVTFVLENLSPSADTLLFESIDKVKDYLYCRAVLTAVDEKKTKVDFQFKISMTREKASDVHILAGLLGEKFLSDKMKDRLEGDLEEFISKATKDMYITSRTSGKE